MTPLDLPAALFDAAQHPPCVIAVAAGDTCPNGSHGGIVVVYADGPELEGPDPLCEGTGVVPPDALTALVDQPCERCGAMGSVPKVDASPSGITRQRRLPQRIDCPAGCFDGVAPVALRTKCETCGGGGVVQGDLRSPVSPAKPCPHGSDGYRSLKVKVACVPIVADDRDIPARCVIIRDDHKQIMVWLNGRRRRIGGSELALLCDQADWLAVPHWALIVVEVAATA